MAGPEDGVSTVLIGRDLRRGRTVAAPDRPVIVMRDDTPYVVAELAARLSGHVAGGRPGLVGALSAAYRCFQRDVRRAVRDCAAEEERPDLHLIDGTAIGEAIRARLGATAAVSLDPLVRGIPALGISRGFDLGGRTSRGLVARPGHPSVPSQVERLSRALAGRTCVLVEDDIHSGGTIERVLEILAAAGVRVARVVTGIAAGPVVLGSLSVPVEPVLRYEGTTGRLDIADPRNFLLGVSGLVVRLPAGGWGRAPYWLPFVTTSARLPVDPLRDNMFARMLMQANARFYERVEQHTRCLVRVGDLHPSVRMLLTATGTAAAETPVRQVLHALADGLDRCVRPGRVRDDGVRPGSAPAGRTSMAASTC